MDGVEEGMADEDEPSLCNVNRLFVICGTAAAENIAAHESIFLAARFPHGAQLLVQSQLSAARHRESIMAVKRGTLRALALLHVRMRRIIFCIRVRVRICLGAGSSVISWFLNVNDHDCDVIGTPSFHGFHSDPVTGLVVTNFTQGRRLCGLEICLHFSSCAENINFTNTIVHSS